MRMRPTNRRRRFPLSVWCACTSLLVMRGLQVAGDAARLALAYPAAPSRRIVLDRSGAWVAIFMGAIA